MRVINLNPNQLHRNEKFLERRKSKITKISEKTIESLKNKMNWEGHGTKLDPIVIEHLGYRPLIVKIYRSSLYYHIKNLTIDKLTCRNTQNITIENCTIKHLKIEGCYNLTLVNNKVLKHKIVFTKGSTFIDNKIAQIENLKQNYYTTQVNPIGRQVTNPLTCCLCFLVISAFISGTSYWVIGFIPLGVLIFLNYSTYAKNKRIDNKPDNTYVNNVDV